MLIDELIAWNPFFLYKKIGSFHCFQGQGANFKPYISRRKKTVLFSLSSRKKTKKRYSLKLTKRTTKRLRNRKKIFTITIMNPKKHNVASINPAICLQLKVKLCSKWIRVFHRYLLSDDARYHGFLRLKVLCPRH
jgi:hypothetical protein